MSGSLVCFVKKQQGMLTLTGAGMEFRIESELKFAIPFKVIENTLQSKGEKKILKIMYKADSGVENVSIVFKNEKDRQEAILAIKNGLANAPASMNTLGSTDTRNGSANSGTKGQPALSDLEIQSRQKLLQENPQWRQLHLNLVIKQKLLTEQEFWQDRQEILNQQHFLSTQKKGTSSVILADIKPTGEGTEIKYSLNGDIIHSIFIHYPQVHKAYLDNVPDKLSEKEFWGKYFSSKYFHRNRIVQMTSADDIFAKYMQDDGQDTKIHPDLDFKSKNILVDLTCTAEDHGETGNGPDFTMTPGRVKESLPLIRKFNRHSELILEGITKSKKLKVKDILKETEFTDLECKVEDDGLELGKFDSSQYFSKPGQDSMNTVDDTQSVPLTLVTLESLVTRIDEIGIDVIPEPEDMLCTPIESNIISEANTVQSNCIELLRHFWASLGSRERCDRIAESLKKMRTRIIDIEQGFEKSEGLVFKGLVGPIQKSINAALNKYSQLD